MNGCPGWTSAPRVEIRETGDGQGTGFQNIADNAVKPVNVTKLRITFSGSGDGGALKSLRHMVSACLSRLGEAGSGVGMTNETEGTMQLTC